MNDSIIPPAGPIGRFCVTCRWCDKPPTSGQPFCFRDHSARIRYDPVTGEAQYPVLVLCRDERESTDADCCGPNGKFWTPIQGGTL